MRYKDKYKVTSHEADTHNQIRPHMVMRFMQETADHQMRDRKPTYQELFFEKGKSFILTRFSIEILGNIGMYDDIEVETWQSNDNGKGVSFIRCYEMLNKGELVARGYALWAMVEISTKRLCRVKEEDFSNYEAEEPLNLSIPVRFRLPKNLDFEEVLVKKVKYSDCDMNMHMNNTNYGKLICDAVENIKDKRVTSLNIHFKSEAPLDDDIVLSRADSIDLKNLTEENPLYNWAMEYGDENADQLHLFKSKVTKGDNIDAVVGTRRY